MSAFAAAVGALFADPNIGRDAVYIAPGGAPLLVRVVARRADAVSDFGDARLAPIRALRESPAARAALGTLEKHGWLVPLTPGSVVRGTPRREAWRVVRGGGDVV